MSQRFSRSMIAFDYGSEWIATSIGPAETENPAVAGSLRCGGRLGCPLEQLGIIQQVIQVNSHRCRELPDGLIARWQLE